MELGSSGINQSDMAVSGKNDDLKLKLIKGLMV